MDLPGAIREEEELQQKPEKESPSPSKSQGVSLPLGRRRSSKVERQGPQYTVRVWEYGITGWTQKHHFCAGLEVDLKIHATSCAELANASAAGELQKDVHLPSTSLAALTQLEESLKRPNGLLLDIADSRNLQFTELFSAMLTELGKDAPGSVVQEAELLLQEHPYVAQEKLPSQDTVGESMDIFLCSGGSGLEKPSMALARIKSEAKICFAVEEGTGEMRFAAVVLCDVSSEDSGRSLARALATTFMDEEFSHVARSTPKEDPEAIQKALRAYLAKLTIVPTVNLNKAAAAAGPMSPKSGKYTLSDSLVSGIQRRMSLMTPAEAFDVSKGDIGFTRQHSQDSETGEVPPTTYHIEVDRLSEIEEGWHMEKCLRQGLEVDFSLKEETPHLPHVSCVGLQEVKRLVVQHAVAIDVGESGVVPAAVDRLKVSGLPTEVCEEVQRGLELRLKEGAHQEALFGTELVKPNKGDEAVLVLVVKSKRLQDTTVIRGAFIRSQVALPLEGQPPARFLFVLVGPRNGNGATKLMEVGDSLAALAVDEELIALLAKAETEEHFTSAFDGRLGDIVLLPHAHVNAKRNLEDEMLLSPKGVPSPATARRMSNAVQTQSTTSLGVVGTKSYVNQDGQIVTNVKSDVGFDHMHKHGPADDLKSDSPVSVQCIWGVVAMAQKYALPLVFGVLLAMIWINVDEHSYHAVTHEALIEGWQILGHDVSLHFLVNDIFMCFFFGLAIKEVTEALLPGGSLSPIRRATNPLMATLGGVVGPVAAYVVFVVIFYEASMFNGILCEENAGAGDAHRRLGTNETYEEAYRDCRLADFINGWGVPTATDISLAWMFAILVFGTGHPAINYLLLLAIADDALGMAIIAIAYPDPIHPVQPVWFCLVVGGAVVAFIMRYVGVRFWTAYVFVAGPIAWFGLILAQVHPALALVCIVPFMPATHSHHDDAHHEHAQSEVDAIGSFLPRAKSEILRRAAAEFMARRGAPLHAFEHHMKLIVDFGMFFFGAANAGVKVDGVGTLTAATFIALALGKTLGIVFFALLAHAMGFLLPVGLTVVDLFAMSALGGVGLTVALFVSNEAFVDKGLQSQAKMGAVFSVASALLAFAMKFFGDKIFHPNKQPDDEEDETEVDLFPESEEEADEWLDVVAMNDIMQVLWTQRKYQSRGTDLNVKKLARTVSRQNLNAFRTDGPIGLSRQSSRLGSKEFTSKENSRRPSDSSKEGCPVRPI